MSTVAPADCPLCREPLHANWCGPLYGCLVCETCRRAFARRRHAAFIIDWVLAALAANAAGLSLGAVPAGSALHATPSLVFLFLMGCRDAWGGVLPGRRWMDLQVIDARTGVAAGLWTSILRNLVPVLVFPIALYIAAEVKSGLRMLDRGTRAKVVWRRYRRATPFLPAGNNCWTCGYDLTGNVSGICPECGWAASGQRSQPA